MPLVPFPAPLPQGSLAKIEALAVLQMYAQPERSGEGQQPKEECEIVLRAEGLAKALGPEVRGCHSWVRAGPRL